MMARFIFLSFFMLVGALAPTKAQNNFPYPALPDSLRSVEQRATYLSEHYWDNFNFSDTLELANKEMAEQGFVNFIDILARFDQEIAQKVSVNKDDAVVQVAFNVPFSGPNGIGGVTVQGSVSGYKIQTDKKGTTQVSMSVTGIGISAQIWITMYKGSHEASVEILPNFNSRRLTLNGVILPLHKSTVFQGRTL